MKNNIRAVIDTNAIISAVLLPRSISRQAFDWVIKNGSLLVSQQTLDELNEVLCRPKFDKYIPVEKRLEFFAALVRKTEMVKIAHTITACRDIKDNKFLELAVSGKATHIISGDGDLLVLNPFQGVQIISPAAVLSLYTH